MRPLPPFEPVPSPLTIGLELFRLPPWQGYRLTRKRLFNLLRSRFEWMRGATVLSAYPVRLTLEPINACQLRCPACLTGLGEVGRSRTPMSLDLYRQTLAELGDYLFELEFTNWGEPLLCPQLPTMVREAHERGISTTVVTHLSVPLDDTRAEELIASGLTILGVSIDGARQEVYERYRVNGRLSLVLENCRRIVAAKKRLRARWPRIIWSYHTFPHNLGDVERAASMAAELGMEFAATKGAVLAEEWGRDTDWRFFGEPLPVRCPSLWGFAVLNNDGGVPPCQGAFYEADDMGRATLAENGTPKRSFMEVWNGARFQAARRLFAEGHSDEKDRQLLCFDCPVRTLDRELRAHLARGGTRRTFEVRFTTNDVWKYFVGRRFARWFSTTATDTRHSA